MSAAHATNVIRRIRLPKGAFSDLCALASDIPTPPIFGFNAALHAVTTLAPQIENTKELVAARDTFREEKRVVLTGATVPPEVKTVRIITEEDSRSKEFLERTNAIQCVTTAVFLFVTDSAVTKLFCPSPTDRRVVRPIVPKQKEGPAYQLEPLKVHNDRSGCDDIRYTALFYARNSGPPLEVIDLDSVLYLLTDETIHNLSLAQFRADDDDYKTLRSILEIADDRITINFAGFQHYRSETPEGDRALQELLGVLCDIPFEKMPKKGFVMIDDETHLHKRGAIAPTDNERLIFRQHVRRNTQTYPSLSIA